MQRVRKALFLSLLICGCAIAADAPDAWPRWRGPEFNGVARGDAPLTWSDKDHIAWKVEVPGKGHSSPVIWGDRLFLTTDRKSTRLNSSHRCISYAVFCFKKKQARMLHRCVRLSRAWLSTDIDVCTHR